MYEKVKAVSAIAHTSGFFALGVALSHRHRVARYKNHRIGLPFVGFAGRQLSRADVATGDQEGSSIGSWREPGFNVWSAGGGSFEPQGASRDIQITSGAHSAAGMDNATLPLSESSTFMPLLAQIGRRQRVISSAESGHIPRTRDVPPRTQNPGVEHVGRSRMVHRSVSSERQSAAYVLQNAVSVPSVNLLHQRPPLLNEKPDDGKGSRPAFSSETVCDQASSGATFQAREEGAGFNSASALESPGLGNIGFPNSLASRPSAIRLMGAISISRMVHSPGVAFGLLQGIGVRRLKSSEEFSNDADSVTTRSLIADALPGSRVPIMEALGSNGAIRTPRNVEVEDLHDLPGLRSPADRQEPGPYIRKGLQGLSIDTAAVERMVERKIKAQVRQLRDVLASQAQERPEVRRDPIAYDITNDEVVRRLMQRMSTLAQEEHFRVGKLR